MKSGTLTRLSLVALIAVVTMPLRVRAEGARATVPGAVSQLTSTTFENDQTLPISMINNNAVNGVNACSIDGSTGGNQSPELSWTQPKRGTRSFVVVAYDVTAAFTHWGMYNISPAASGLPENAGAAGSTYGTQIINDFFIGPEYDGPCPSGRA